MDERLAKVEAKVEAELAHVAELVHELPFDRRFRAISLASLVHGTLYFTANHFPLGEPRLLPMTALDEAMPFLPWTVSLYLSAYALAFVAFLSLRKAHSGLRFLQAFLPTVVVGGFIHWVAPTTYPRERFPVPAGCDVVSRTLLEALRRVDAPTSCLPSLHVAVSVLSALLVWRERPRVSLALSAWAVAIAVSTLTTKQHYVVDIVSGTVLAVVVIAVVDVLRARSAKG